MKILNKMQRRAAIWILGAFKTLPSEGIKAITGIIPIKFYLQKLAEKFLIYSFKLLANHIIRDLMDDSPHQSKNLTLTQSVLLQIDKRTSLKDTSLIHAISLMASFHLFLLFTRNLLLVFVYQTFFLIVFPLT